MTGFTAPKMPAADIIIRVFASCDSALKFSISSDIIFSRLVGTASSSDSCLAYIAFYSCVCSVLLRKDVELVPTNKCAWVGP